MFSDPKTIRHEDKQRSKIFGSSRGARDRHAALGQKFTAKIIGTVLLLTVVLGGNGFARVGVKAEGEGIAKAPAFDGADNRRAVEHVVTIESLRVHYIESGTGRTVVMIHGNAGGVEDFQFGAVDLLSREYRVIAIDRPGHGKSDRPAGKPATVEYQAELLHQTLAQLGISQPVLVGHSWGGALVLAYALNYPNDISGLVLLAPAAYADEGGNHLMRATANTPVIGDLALLAVKSILGRRMLKRALSQAFYPQTVPENYFKAASTSWLGRKQLKAYLEDEWELNDSLRKMSKRYGEIRIPVVIVTGDEDQVVSPKDNAYRLRAAIPQAQFIELKNTGHEIPLTHPESISTALNLISPTTASLDLHPAVLAR